MLCKRNSKKQKGGRKSLPPVRVRQAVPLPVSSSRRRELVAKTASEREHEGIYPMATLGSAMRHRGVGKLLLLLASFIGVSVALELGVRLAVRPSPSSYGRLFGVELPPRSPFGDVEQYRQPLSSSADQALDGSQLTRGDLFGIYRSDSLLGYAPAENAVSRNAWWQSSDLGALTRAPTPRERPQETSRLLVFGESFAQGSRIRQEAAWPAVLDSADRRLDVVNLAVDGYSMAQALLRYRGVRQRLDHDIVLLMFAPSVDLWRDVSTLRSLRSWEGYPMAPRFVLERGELKLVRSLYPDRTVMVARNQDGLSRKLKEHLQKYDSFYCAAAYADPPLLGSLVLYKIGAAAWCGLRLRRLERKLLEVDGEAMQVTLKILEAMQDGAEADGKTFILVVTPTHAVLHSLGKDSAFDASWTQAVSAACESIEMCLDLTARLSTLPADVLDTGHGGTHFGPETNRIIAEAIHDFLQTP